MKTKSFFLSLLVLGFLALSCSKQNTLTNSNSAVSLKSSITSGVQDLSTAMAAITTSTGYQVVTGPTDLATKSTVISPLDTTTHSILLTNIAGVYDYKATTIKRGSSLVLQFFTKTATSTQAIFRMPEEKVKASRSLLQYRPSDTLLVNNYTISLSDYQYRFALGNGWDYKMASTINIKNADAGTLKIQSSNSPTLGYKYASEYLFTNGYQTKFNYTSGDTANSTYSISNGTKTLYEEKYIAIRSKTDPRYRETTFSLQIGEVLIERELGPGYTLDSAKVYVSGVLQLKSKVEFVDKASTSTTDNCISNQKRELKITFDDGTSSTFSELAGSVITDITTLFAAIRQGSFATRIIDWIAWDIYTKK
jgi:hypothetical protein